MELILPVPSPATGSPACWTSPLAAPPPPAYTDSRHLSHPRRNHHDATTVRRGALLLALGLGVLPACGEDKKEAQGREKWNPLFNGKDLTGWKMPAKPNKGDIKEIVTIEKDGKVVAYEGKLKKEDKQVPLWRVEDGLLIGSGPPATCSASAATTPTSATASRR